MLQKLAGARERGENRLTLSLDLDRTTVTVETGAEDWIWQKRRYPYPAKLKDRTIYGWNGTEFAPVSCYEGGLYKLVPTSWGPPTFEIDGIKMLPTAKVSPFEDAQRKVALVAPRGKRVLDCCAGLGYFAHWCLVDQAASVRSFEKSEAVLWLRAANPWSPRPDPRLALGVGDISRDISGLPARSFDVILHDPPRFGIAGDLYSRLFYEQLARVIAPEGVLFHYVGTPNKLTSGRDVPREVQRRLRKVGFQTRTEGDGIIARWTSRTTPR